MFCRWCGSSLPEGAETCPKCGKPASLPSDSDVFSRESVDKVVADTTRAARDLAAAAARFTEKLAAQVKATADDPKGSASRAARRVARDLDAAREEIEKAFRDL
jgi:zinc-ribbon domain